MRTVELFCGTKSFSKYAKKLGHETFTVDNNAEFEPNLVVDLLKNWPIQLRDKIREADIVWMSPPCQVFSMASGNRHWEANRTPKTPEAAKGFRMLQKCQRVAEFCDILGKIYFIENPVARARWFLPEETRKTVWYCQYGDKRAKPTDIWTNLKGWEGKRCKNGAKDHEPAPRGSKTGTQGLKGAKARGAIPEALFEELFEVIHGTEKS